MLTLSVQTRPSKTFWKRQRKLKDFSFYRLYVKTYKGETIVNMKNLNTATTKSRTVGVFFDMYLLMIACVMMIAAMIYDGEQKKEQLAAKGITGEIIMGEDEAQDHAGL